MSTIDRRRFLGLGAQGLLAAGFAATLGRRAIALPAGGAGWIGGVAPQKKLLLFFLRGGNDGTNTVFPHADPLYPVQRGGIALTQGQGIDIGSPICRLHPAMEPLTHVPAGDVAFAHRVGTANASRSHFDAQQIWESGYAPPPGARLERFGFAGRYVQQVATADNPLPAAACESSAPRSLTADDRSLPQIPELLGYHLDDAARQAALAQVYDAAGDTPVARDGRILFGSMDAVDGVIDDYEPGDLSPHYPGGVGVHAREATFLLTHTDCNVATLSLGGFDTHSAQGGPTGRHANALNALARTLRGIHDDAADAGLWNDLVVLVVSEFGRTDVNASGGTDHGLASVAMVAGGAVNGGAYNCGASTWWRDGASTSPLEPDGALLPRTDFRAVYAEVLDRHLGMDATALDAILPGWSALAGSDPAFDYLGLL